MATTRTARRSRWAVVLLAAVCSGLLAGPARATGALATGAPSAWYQPGVYAGHSGNNPFERVVTASTAAAVRTDWTRSGATSAPLVSGGRVWTVGEDGVLRSLRVGTGALLTSTRVGRCTKGAVPPVMSRTVVLVPTTGCGRPDSVRAYSAADGHLLWQREPGPRLTSATLDDGVVYLSGARALVTALSVNDGTVRWTRGGGGGDVFSSAVNDGVLYTTAFQVVQARRLTDGKVLWSRTAFEFNGYVAAVGGRVYVSFVNQSGASGDQRLTALTPQGAVLWTSFVGGGVSSPDVRPSVSGGLVLVTSVGGEVVALDAVSGAPRWSASFSDELSTVSVAGGVAWTVEDGALYGRALDTGRQLVRRAVAGAEGEPVVAGGHVFTGGGSLRALAP